MTVIATLLEQQQPLMTHLYHDDMVTVEEALLDYLPETLTTATLHEAVTALAEDHKADVHTLWEALCAHWNVVTDGDVDTLDEAFRSKFRRAKRKVKRSVGRAKRRYNRAKNSRAGKAIRRVANSQHGRDLAGAAASIFGI